ncbi:hypothetical protein NDU88_004183 [Pleurodeles waltl]|uniref:Uncharacterized protein n=1 Tax=Pleurodeles waltl TaxID=8319 RepID=A0AAV7SI45_PLEWA|nr:hypothetical protein NDU88_004183 [Pleurodeles waltl]
MWRVRTSPSCGVGLHVRRILIGARSPFMRHLGLAAATQADYRHNDAGVDVAGPQGEKIAIRGEGELRGDVASAVYIIYLHYYKY